MMKKVILFCFALLPLLGFSQTTYNVTFQVDLNQYSGSYNVVEVFGTFNNFAGGVTILTDANSDGVYDVTVPIAAGNIEFLYALDTTGSFNYVLEDFTSTQPFCTVTNGNFTNRFLTVSADTTLAINCWEACVDCDSITPTSNITFQVDMSEYTGSYTQVNINGTFNGFCGTCAVMNDANNDSIYDITINVPNDTIEWLFTVDGFTDAESFNPGDPCTKTTIDGGSTFVNRVFLPSGDTTLPDVCWNSCVDCESVGLEEEWLEDLTISPNPSNGIVYLNGMLRTRSTLNIEVTDLQGRVIYSNTLQTDVLNEAISLENMADGIYLVNISTEKHTITDKIVIRK
jgi:polyisoprenoid-binding protein YceI